MVRYEDLRAEPARELRRITALMGETFSDPEIEQAVEFGAFDNLRALESKGFFRQGGLAAAQPERPRELQGAPGQGRRLPGLLHRGAGRRAGPLVAERLSPAFGYAPAPAAGAARVAV